MLSLAILCLVFACETDPDVDSETTQQIFYQYNTSQQFPATESFVIDFEEFNSGDIVSEVLITNDFENILVAGITMAFPDSNAAMIFDSSNPTGNDFDIGTPNEAYGGPGVGNGGASNNTSLGNVLILSEDLDSTDPDDIFEVGASFVFDFSANDNVTLKAFDILDIEESSNPTVVTLYDSDDNVLLSKEITPGGNNSKTTVNLENTSGVSSMEIIMNSSGAIDNIALDIETQEPCVDCDSSIAELTFKFTGSIDQTPVRVETADGEIIFEQLLNSNEEFTVSIDNTDGTFESDLIVFVDELQVAFLDADCTQVIGPGYIIPDLEVVSGITETGNQLCPVEVTAG